MFKKNVYVYYLMKLWAVGDWQSQCVKTLSQYHVIWSIWTVTATTTGEDFQHCHSTEHHTDRKKKSTPGIIRHTQRQHKKVEHYDGRAEV